MSEIIETQVSGSGPTPEGLDYGTDLILPPRSTASRLEHFPSEVYDLSAESHLVRFVKALTGSSGAGQLRERNLVNRLRQSLQGIRYLELDRLYGALFGVRRNKDEELDIDPYTQGATSDEWLVQNGKDISYRSRVSQFARAVTFGPTPTGIELAAEALLSVDCDVYESWAQADSGYRTYEELQEEFTTYTLNPANLATNPIMRFGFNNLRTETIEFRGAPTFGLGGTGTYAQISDASDGPTIDGVQVTSYGRKTWLLEGSNDTTFVVGGIFLHPYQSADTGWMEIDLDVPRHLEVWVRVRPGPGDPQNLQVALGWLAENGDFPEAPTDFGTPVAVTGDWQKLTTTIGGVGSWTNNIARLQAWVTLRGATNSDKFLVGTTMEFTGLNLYEGEPDAEPLFLASSGTLYADIEGLTYAELQGEGLGRLSGDERREFVVRPKRRISQEEAYELARVLRRIKPADARFTIDYSGSDPYAKVPLRGVLADSNFWEVVPKVATRDITGAPYAVPSQTPVEQPRPPFTAHQGEAWSYLTDVNGVAAFRASDLSDPTSFFRLTPQRITMPDGTRQDYPPAHALTPARYLLAGRSVSDGVMVTNPYWAASPQTFPDLSPVYTDRTTMAGLADMLTRNPIGRLPYSPSSHYWTTPPRNGDDSTHEILEVGLSHPRRINYISMELAHYPHTLLVQAHIDATWVTVGTYSIEDSVPAFLPRGQVVDGHPDHAHAGHWQRASWRVPAFTTSSLRFVLTRIPGDWPEEEPGKPLPYSLAMRSLDVGYRVSSLADVPAEARSGQVPIGTSVDVLGSQVDFHLRDLNAARLLDGQPWISDPQPVNYAVVNLYLDVRTPDGDSQVIDHFRIDPTHPGAHLSLYWTEALPDQPNGPVDLEWYERQVWHPVSRDYYLQRGYLHIPPTAARHFKFEFTALSAEPHPTMLNLARRVRLFPRELVSQFTVGSANSILPPGLNAAIEIGDDRRYFDALVALRDSQRDPRDFSPTEAMFATDPDALSALRSQSWALGYTPWHQGGPAPKFWRAQVHDYEEVEVRHDTEVGFFVGMRSIEAFRSDVGGDDDTLVYDEHFYDFRNIEPDLTWTFNPGAMTTGLETECVATSKVYFSRHNIRAIQFATQQTDPVQLLPDDDFRDPSLATIDWSDNPEGWHQIGDGLVVYSPRNHSARVVRYSDPVLRPTNVLPGLPRPLPHEAFSFHEWAIDTGVQSMGGVESVEVGVSAEGKIYGAVRMTLTSRQLTSPIYMEVVDGFYGTLLGRHKIPINPGETVERFFPFDLTGGASVRIRIVQHGPSNDTFEVDRLSLFDPGIRWEFSNDGGGTWVNATDVRNNANGVVTFPEVGNHLRWRATGMRPNMSLSALRIRVHYLGIQSARYEGTHRGPNASTYDLFPPITEDPMFTTWTGPVPREWFMAFRQFPNLVSIDGPNISEFSRFYSRPVTDNLAEPEVITSRSVTSVRPSTEVVWHDPDNPLLYSVERSVSVTRTSEDSLPQVSDDTIAVILPGDTFGMPVPVVYPTFGHTGNEEAT